MNANGRCIGAWEVIISYKINNIQYPCKYTGYGKGEPAMQLLYREGFITSWLIMKVNE